MQFKYKTKGVCSNEMHFEIEDNIVKNLTVIDTVDHQLIQVRNDQLQIVHHHQG